MYKQWRLIALFLYRMTKRVRRIISGQTAVDRICGGATSWNTGPPGAMSFAFLSEWRTSKQLASTYSQFGEQPDMDVRAARSAIREVKGSRSSPPSESSDTDTNLLRCLTAIRMLNALKSSVESLRAESFDTSNQQHVDTLESLWSTLQPGHVRKGSGLISKDWGTIGFQQKNPVSDFRGGGMLGLLQVVHFAQTRTHTAHKMLHEPSRPEARYPWACAGINVTMKAIEALREGALDKCLLAAAERTISASPDTAERYSAGGVANHDARQVLLPTYNDIYGDMFEMFHSRWVAAKPENVLAFKSVFERTMAEAKTQLSTSGRVTLEGSVERGSLTPGRKSD